MNNQTIIAIVVVILVVIGGYFLLSSPANAPEPVQNETVDTAATAQPSASTSQTVTVTYKDAGFSPVTVAIKLGDTVRFVNSAGSGMWVGVDEHPTHTGYDGTATKEHCADGVNTTGTFDACHQMTPGESYEFTFMKAGSFDYHNHARSNHGGTVSVSQ